MNSFSQKNQEVLYPKNENRKEEFPDLKSKILISILNKKSIEHEINKNEKILKKMDSSEKFKSLKSIIKIKLNILSQELMKENNIISKTKKKLRNFYLTKYKTVNIYY